MERINKLKEYLQTSPDDSFLLHALALEYVKLGDDGEAKNLFEKILYDDPKYIGSYYHLAKLYERTGEIEQALHWFEKGMATAKSVHDQHTYNELQAAYDDLLP